MSTASQARVVRAIEVALAAWAAGLPAGDDIARGFFPPNSNTSLTGYVMPAAGDSDLPAMVRFSVALAPTGSMDFSGRKRQYVGSMAFIIGVLPDQGAGQASDIVGRLEELFPVNVPIPAAEPGVTILVTGAAEIGGASLVNGRYTVTAFLPVLAGFYQ